jgi:hypothetical protein
MICDCCKTAGAYNAEANHKVWFAGVKAAEEWRYVARRMHAKCSSIDCTCQHILGDVLNRNRIHDDSSNADSV